MRRRGNGGNVFVTLARRGATCGATCGATRQLHAPAVDGAQAQVGREHQQVGPEAHVQRAHLVRQPQHGGRDGGGGNHGVGQRHPGLHRGAQDLQQGGGSPGQAAVGGQPGLPVTDHHVAGPSR